MPSHCKRHSVLALLCLLWPSLAVGATYYVKNGGNNGADGLSDANAWATIAKVNATAFVAGDSVLFKRGSTWNEDLVVDSNGTSGSRITYGAYDTGAAPRIQSTGGAFSRSILVTGDFNIIESFFLDNGHEACVRLNVGADSNIIRNNELFDCGIGAYVLSQNNLITGNNAHDLTMVVNDATAGNDYGALGYWWDNTGNEFSYNRCVDCIAPSMDFGTDGGCFETFTTGSNTTVHHNYCENTNGVFEANGTYNNVVFTFNLFVQPDCATHSCGAICLQGTPTNIVFDHNTFYYNRGVQGLFRFLDCVDDGSMFTMRNNIIQAQMQIADAANEPAVHTHNRYYQPVVLSGSGIGYALSTGESVGDPLWVVSGTDFHLQAGSAARDTGINLGYVLDYDNRPPNGVPDMGAYEYWATPGAPTNVTVTAKPAQPTITNLNPGLGNVGASVTITGFGFAATQGSATVTFNGTAVTSVTSWSALSLTVLVPTGATTGNVVVTQNGLTSAGSTFTVGSCMFAHPVGYPLSGEGSCFPDATTTGPTGSLTPSGSITTTSNGQIIENVDVTGLITIAHTNVTLRNFRCRSNGGGICLTYAPPYTWVITVEDCEFDGAGNTGGDSAIWIGNPGSVMRRCEIINYGEGPGSCSDVLFEDNYFHDFQDFASVGAHQDTIQCEFGGGNTVRHNTLFMEAGGEAIGNAAIQFGDQGQSNQLIEGNLLGGGGYTLSIGGEAVNIKHNYFTTMFAPLSGFFGPIATYDIHKNGGVSTCGNRWYDGPDVGDLLSGESACP